VTVLACAAWFARSHADALRQLVERHTVAGAAVYVVLNVLDAVIAPGATLPLIPIAARAWGHVAAALVTTVGWTAGSLIAFSIARRWGTPIVKKLTSIERVRRMRRYVPKDPFWTVVMLRMVLPMDVLSYVLGLFSDLSWQKYTFATALGLTPSAFILAYIGKMPHAYEWIMLAFAAIVVSMTIYSASRALTADAETAKR